MKKLISALIVFALVCALAPAVLAADDTAEAPIFSDVPEDAWYAGDLEVCFYEGLADGTGGGKFSPGKNVSLAEAVTFAARVHRTLFVPYDEDLFVQGDPWYQVYVDYAVANGIMEKDRYSDLSAPATRRQFAALIAAALSEDMPAAINPVEDGAIPDLEAGSEAYDQIYALYRAGILTGSENGRFWPEETLKRAEAVAIIARCVDGARARSFMLTGDGCRVNCVGGIAFDLPEGFRVDQRAANQLSAYAVEDGQKTAGIMALAQPMAVTPDTAAKIKPLIKNLINALLKGIEESGISVGETELAETTVLGYDGLTFDAAVTDGENTPVSDPGRIHADIALDTDTGCIVMFVLTVLDTAEKDYQTAYETLLANAKPDTSGGLRPSIRPEFVAAVDELMEYMKAALELSARYPDEDQQALLEREMAALDQRYAGTQEKFNAFEEDMTDGETEYLSFMLMMSIFSNGDLDSLFAGLIG